MREIMEKDTTRTLSKALEKIHMSEEADQFIEKHSQSDFAYFYEYLNWIIAKKELTTAEVITRSGVNKNYVYNILNGDKKKPGRDKILALCIGARMSYSETQRALEIGNVAPLYPKDERDVRIAVGINSGAGDVMKINLILDEYGLEPINV
ncbi:hypothetical protein CE91St49_15250 [Emergencia timonensis]|nr:hypothetical protein CE91St48_15300 [Emergencia timonensis]BDF12178.1 hypothetical protein CE91St49_15250 [Emergencia timonensis]